MYKSKICMGSVFGSPATSLAPMVEGVKAEFKKQNVSACEIGCLDGKNSFVIAKSGFKLDCYEENELYINGGQVLYPFVVDNTISLEKIQMYGLKKRMKTPSYKKFQDKMNIYETNFYKENEKQYDFVYTRRSLSRMEYADLSMDSKINALKKAVKEKGILYIEYLIKTDEYKDPNRFLDRGQMEEYFTRKGWRIFYCTEGDWLNEENPDLENPEFHKYNVGRIKVMKDKNKKLDYYKINIIF